MREFQHTDFKPPILAAAFLFVVVYLLGAPPSPSPRLSASAVPDGAPIASITILDPDTNRATKEVTVNENDSVKPTLLVLDTDGVQRSDFVLNYTSLDTDVATVGPSGTIFGVKAGFSTLTISSGGVVATGTITVVKVDSGTGGYDVTGIIQDRAQRLYLASSGDHTILLAQNLKEAPTLYAGISGMPGLKNDLRLAALFKNPSFLAFNQANGTLYVSDSGNHVIRRIQPGAEGQVETLAGSGAPGNEDGTGVGASFSNAQGVALDNRGYLWLADSGNHTIRRINLATRVVETIAGKAGTPGSSDGKSGSARFNFPVGIALEPETLVRQLERESAGEPPPPVRMIVADTANGQLRRVSEDGMVETIRAAEPSARTQTHSTGLDPLLAPVNLLLPSGVAVDQSGVIYAAEPLRGRVAAILQDGSVVSAAGKNSFANPRGLVITQNGRLLVSGGNRSGQEISYGAPEISSITPDPVRNHEGELITIKGKNFAQPLSVLIRTTAIRAVETRDSKTLSFFLPVLSSGLTTLTVQTRGGVAQKSILVAPPPLSDLPRGFITTVAGGTTFLGDGAIATSANLFWPQHSATDTFGDLFVADVAHSRVRKIEAQSGIITTVAGNGIFAFSGDNGPAIEASLAYPEGVALDLGNNLLIADSYNHRVRRVDRKTGIITTVAGSGDKGFSGDNGPATSANLNYPVGIAVDPSGNLFIGDQSNDRVRKVDPDTKTITTVASIELPTGIISDPSGNLLVSTGDQIRKIDAITKTMTTVAGGGNPADQLGDNGQATAAVLDFPQGLWLDLAGNLLIADTYHERIRRVDAVSGIITTVAGNGTYGFSGDGGPATAASLRFPWGVAVDAGGNLFIADVLNNRIRKVDPITKIISTFAGNGEEYYLGESGPATGAALPILIAIAADSTGNLFLSANQRVFRIDASTGILRTFAGGGEPKDGLGDGGPATSAKFVTTPAGLAVDASGNLLIADGSSERVRKVDSKTGTITTVAGNGKPGFSGDGGAATAASLSTPTGVAFDKSGNLFIADFGNNRIRKVDAATSTISSVAGTGALTFSGDGGPATGAALNRPINVSLDSLGNLFIVDSNNLRIRKVAAGTGIITTVAGNGSRAFGGDDGPATSASLNSPRGLAVDSAGNLFIGDAENYRVRKVDSAGGIITTVIGTGAKDSSGDNGPAISAALRPGNLALDSAENLLIVDGRGQRIRAVRGPAGPDPAPRMDITMNKSLYSTGDTITANEFRVRNFSATSSRVKLRVWLKVPGVGEVSLIDVGSDGSFSLPGKTDSNLGPLPLLAIGSSFPPRGKWELNARIINPATDALLSEDINPFEIQ